MQQHALPCPALVGTPLPEFAALLGPTLAPAATHSQVCKGYPSAKEGLLVNARFLLAQFEQLDGASGHKALKFLETDFGKSLAKEVSGAVTQLSRRTSCSSVPGDAGQLACHAAACVHCAALPCLLSVYGSGQ